MPEARRSTTGGLGLGTVLALIFIVLKLTGYIGWSWAWVLSPLWIGWGLVLLVVLVVFIVTQVQDSILQRRIRRRGGGG